MRLGLGLGASVLVVLGVSACGLDVSGTAFPEGDARPDVIVPPVDAGFDDGSIGDASVLRGALVSAGTVSSSPSYKVIGTLGQGPSSNAVMRSPSFTFTGGLVGATQTK